MTKEQLVERRLISPARPPAATLIERLSRATALHVADHVQLDGDFLVVQGQLHFYRLSRRTGEIRRVSDGAILELNWHAVSDQMRSVLHRECDSEQQLALRASLLAHDGAFAQWFDVR